MFTTTTTTPTPRTLADIQRSGHLDGYKPGAPRLGSLIDGPGIDREVCEQARCQACGHVGLDYRPFHQAGSYRAFAVCPACRLAEEF